MKQGMNGVLAKPFTRDGMWKSVRSNLGYLMKNPPAEADLSSGAGYYMGGGPYLNTPALKFEAQTPPGNSASTWSPGNMGQSAMGVGLDSGYGFVNGNNQYSMRPNYTATMQSADSSSGRLSDVDSPPEKRQRLNHQANY
jgi:osomolarity two-component system response regulator SKN7